MDEIERSIIQKQRKLAMKACVVFIEFLFHDIPTDRRCLGGIASKKGGSSSENTDNIGFVQANG